jgi:hypothetical protein|uniref:Uncharacterized protein n=1 Tax=viral metagenome TaxID=1070528 RepID=A0A6C0K9I6_9ZZZZ
MSSFYTCPSNSYLPNTGIRRACNCATNDTQPAEPLEQPPCCAKEFSRRINTTDCCAVRPTNEVIFVCGTDGVVSETLTVTQVQSGLISIGMIFTFNQISNAIIGLGTGSGGTGTYTIQSQAIPNGSIITSTNNRGVPLLNSVWEAYRTDTRFWGTLAFPGATNVKKRDPLYPTSESARIAKKLATYKRTEVGGTCGYYTNGIPFIPPGCAPTPTEILNASLPKPSTREACPPARFEGIRSDCDQYFW